MIRQRNAKSKDGYMYMLEERSGCTGSIQEDRKSSRHDSICM